MLKEREVAKYKLYSMAEVIIIIIIMLTYNKTIG